MSGGVLEPEALPILSMVVVVALSTSAQVLIGLDGAGAQRYRLMPLKGWRILLAKDAAFMIVLLVLIAPLEIPASLTGGTRGAGYRTSTAAMEAVPQIRWRFTSGVIWPAGVFQIFAIFAVGMGVLRFGCCFFGLPWPPG